MYALMQVVDELRQDRNLVVLKYKKAAQKGSQAEQAAAKLQLELQHARSDVSLCPCGLLAGAYRPGTCKLLAWPLQQLFFAWVLCSTHPITKTPNPPLAFAAACSASSERGLPV